MISVNAQTQLINTLNKATRFPVFAALYALDVDRLLKKIPNGLGEVTFSGAQIPAKISDCQQIAEIEKIFTKQLGKNDAIRNVIYEAEQLAAQGRQQEAIAFAFQKAMPPETHALNLLYANYGVSKEKLRLYFLNKYLKAYDQAIKLTENTEQTDFFYKIGSAITYPKVDGPLVTVIMPAFNAASTLELAVNSILHQSWHNLQLIIVDDASTDDTLQKAKALAKRDSRIEVLSNPVNVGPYVCRNLGVLHTRGQWLTVHDADDWAFPNRIEQQVNAMIESGTAACIGNMLRMSIKGKVTRASRLDIKTPLGYPFTNDGYQRLCFASIMLRTDIFRKQIGAWDSVKVGADNELLQRVRLLNLPTTNVDQPLFICLDGDTGLTNHPDIGLVQKDGTRNKIRQEYHKMAIAWHQSLKTKRIDFLEETRPFPAPQELIPSKSAFDKIKSKYKENLQIISKSPLFEENWYRAKYHEKIVNSGLSSAAEHYLVYGGTLKLDPSKSFSGKFYFEATGITENPILCSAKNIAGKNIYNNILVASKSLALAGEPNKAIALAENLIGDDRKFTLNILRANVALWKNKKQHWVNYINKYLDYYSIANITCNNISKEKIINTFTKTTLPSMTGSSLVTIIMPAFNSELTIAAAARSILNQTYMNLELIIIDDCSTDGTWKIMKSLAKDDERVKVFRNRKNAGPYVSKNIGLLEAKGDWITGLDADDWSFPQRLEKQLSVAENRGYKAHVFGSITMDSNSGEIHPFGKISTKADGVVRIHAITGFFQKALLRQHLGFWDSVRFGADTEMLKRAEFFLNDGFVKIYEPCMFYMDSPYSLTNNPDTSMNKVHGVSRLRQHYREAWQGWQEKQMNKNNIYCDFPPYSRRYKIPDDAKVSLEDVLINVNPNQ